MQDERKPLSVCIFYIVVQLKESVYGQAVKMKMHNVECFFVDYEINTFPMHAMNIMSTGCRSYSFMFISDFTE